MRQSPKHWLPCLFALLLPAACAPARVATKAPERSLLEQATSRTNTSGWDIDYHHAFGYHWLSDHEVLFARNDDKNDGLYRRDIVTGRERELYALEKLLTALWAGAENLDVSPDGKWTFLYSRKLRRTELIALDGSCHRAIPQGEDTIWLADGHHFAVMDAGKEWENFAQHAVHHWLVCSVEQPFAGTKKRFRTTLPLQLGNSLRMTHTGKQFVLTQWFTDSGDRLPVTRIYHGGLGLNATRETRCVVRPPRGAEIVYAYPSTQGNRIAYVLKRQPAHTASAPVLTIYELWISGNDGGNMHKIGDIEQKEAARDDNHDAPIVRWLPGGTSVSLRYREILYTVPVY